MKLKLILLTLLLCSTAYGSNLSMFGANNINITTTLPSCKRVTLTFSSNFVGNINNVCVSGVAGQCGTSVLGDASLTFEAGAGNQLQDIVVTVSAGNFRYFAIN